MDSDLATAGPPSKLALLILKRISGHDNAQGRITLSGSCRDPIGLFDYETIIKAIGQKYNSTLGTKNIW